MVEQVEVNGRYCIWVWAKVHAEMVIEDLAAALSNLKMNMTGEPVWNVKKHSYSL